MFCDSPSFKMIVTCVHGQSYPKLFKQLQHYEIITSKSNDISV